MLSRFFKKSSAAPARGKRLGYETLESRTVLAGNIVANVSGGNLFLRGDAAGNGAIVFQTNPGSSTYHIAPVVTAGAATTINLPLAVVNVNGVNVSAATVTNVRGYIDADLLGGNDFLAFGTSTVGLTQQLAALQAFENPNANIPVDTDLMLTTSIPRGLTVRSGDGSDGILLSLVARNNVIISTTAGDDLVAVVNSTLHDDLFVYQGEGNDQAGILESTVRDALVVFQDGGDDGFAATESGMGSFTINQGLGSDDLTIAGATIVRDAVIVDAIGNETIELFDLLVRNLTINTGHGHDDVSLEGSQVANLTIATGEGDDSVTIGDFTGVTITSNFTLDLGGGNDSFDHANGANVLVAGFVNVQAGLGNDFLNIGGAGVTATFNRTVVVDTSFGDDELVLFNVNALDSVYAYLGLGNDTLDVENVTVAKRTFAYGGPGTDTLIAGPGLNLGIATIREFE